MTGKYKESDRLVWLVPIKQLKHPFVYAVDCKFKRDLIDKAKTSSGHECKSWIKVFEAIQKERETCSEWG